MSKENRDYVVFTEEMKATHTILVPNMLPMHFKIIGKVMEKVGYKVELLETQGPQIAETGLKYVHNDTCYPAILVIGQFLDALQSGRYDPDKVALVLFQTGGGCRASNYIHLLRKALEKAGMGHVPVISLSMTGLEKHPGFQLTLPLVREMMYGVLYGDLLMTLVNQTKPYEVEKGSAQALADRWTERLAAEMTESRPPHLSHGEGQLPPHPGRLRRPAGGAVRQGDGGHRGGDLREVLPPGQQQPGAVPGGRGGRGGDPGPAGLLPLLRLQQRPGLQALRHAEEGAAALPDRLPVPAEEGAGHDRHHDAHGRFTPPTLFTHTISLVQGTISMGVKMGEGWLLTAEMLELADKGVNNIVCTQPFGCLPNHICGKGMMKPIKAKEPHINIVAIDYDAGATKVNQENRLKLMLANARKNRERQRAGETAVQAQAIRADLVQPAAAAVRAERDEEERSSLSSPALKNA